MRRFTKKPVTIEAILASEVLDGASSGRFSDRTLRDGEEPMPQWIIDAFTTAVIGFESQGGHEVVLINTEGHGQVRAERADWIIRGINGELYPCQPDVFEKTYAPAWIEDPFDKLDAAGMEMRSQVSEATRHAYETKIGEGRPQEVPVLTMNGEAAPKMMAKIREAQASSRAVIQDAEPNGDLLDTAWSIIANAGGGNWETQTEEWRQAARRWRDEYHKTFPSHAIEMANMMAEAWNEKARREAEVWTPAMIADAKRDELQRRMLQWSIECFGREEATSIAQRALRLLEEAIELAQAAGVPQTMVEQLGNYVYGRPPGSLAQEVGGVSVTLLVLCAAAGLSADQEERREVARVLSKPPLHFASRNANKNEAGFKITHLAVTERGPELGGTRKIEELPSDSFPAGYGIEGETKS